MWSQEGDVIDISIILLRNPMRAAIKIVGGRNVAQMFLNLNINSPLEFLWLFR